MEEKLGSVEVQNDKAKMKLPRVDADGFIDFEEREVNLEEWKQATKERLQDLPKIISHLKQQLSQVGINSGEYNVYLYGSVARGQSRGSEDKPWFNSDIDLAICDEGKKIGSPLSTKLKESLRNITFEGVTNIEVSLGIPPDHFDKIHSIRLI